MRFWLVGLACGVAICLQGEAKSAPRMSNPDWLAKPNGDDLSEAYPRLALALNIEGRMVLQCEVNAQGVLQACASLGESPAGLGFSGAGLELASHFRMQPKRINGRAVPGGTVRIPLQFAVPEGKSIPTPPEAPEEALVLARKIMPLLGFSDGLDRVYGIEARRAAYRPGKDLEPTVVTAGQRALTEARVAAVSRHLDFAIRFIASRLTMDELRSWLAFLESPPAVALRGEADATRARYMLVGLAAKQDTISRARAMFCADRDCEQDYIAAPAPPESRQRWLETPDADQMKRGRPFLAAPLALKGAVSLRCKATDLGLLASCAVVEEHPKGVGFGPAAIALSTYYRLKPLASAASHTGKSVELEVLFPMPPSVLPIRPTAETPPSQTLDLARRAVATSGIAQSHLSEVNRWDETFRAKDIPGVDAATRDQARAAFRKAMLDRLPDVTEQFARLLAETLTKAQLETFLGFNTSPVGSKVAATLQEFGRYSGEIGPGIGYQMSMAAQRAFCGTYRCQMTALNLPPEEGTHSSAP